MEQEGREANATSRPFLLFVGDWRGAFQCGGGRGSIENGSDMGKFVGVDGVAHARINALQDISTHLRKDGGCFPHALNGNMRVAVTTADKEGRSGKAARIVARRAGRANQPAGEGDDAAKGLGMTGGKFRGQTCTL